jgi:FkbM family methyltransferase
MISYKNDVWQTLASASKPKVLYGTGDGADKILAAFDYYGIQVNGVFASDSFVRNRTFHGMKVTSYAGAEAQFGDFIAVIAFASSLDSVLDNMYALADAHETYAPDVPVTGSVLFDTSFYNKHKEELDEVRSVLSDDESVFIFDSVVNYKLSGDISYLRAAVSDKEAVWHDLLRPAEYDSYCDLGAYNGDTIRSLRERNPLIRNIYALEPDIRTFRKLTAFCEGNGIGAHLYNTGAWSSSGKTAFAAHGSRSSGINANGRTSETALVTLDSILDGQRADYIKYDVEGAEYEALSGSAHTIKKYSPDLCVSLYHRSEDLFRLPMLIRRLNPDYKFCLRRFKYIPAWDLNLYCI